MKLVRSLLLAILFSMLVGFAVGTVIRMRLERPVRYIGSAAAGTAELARLVPANGDRDRSAKRSSWDRSAKRSSWDRSARRSSWGGSG